MTAGEAIATLLTDPEKLAEMERSLEETGNAFVFARYVGSHKRVAVTVMDPLRVMIDGKRLETWPVEASEAYTKGRIKVLRQTVVDLYGQLPESLRRAYDTQYGEVLEFLNAKEDRAPEA